MARLGEKFNPKTLKRSALDSRRLLGLRYHALTVETIFSTIDFFFCSNKASKYIIIIRNYSNVFQNWLQLCSKDLLEQAFERFSFEFQCGNSNLEKSRSSNVFDFQTSPIFEGYDLFRNHSNIRKNFESTTQEFSQEALEF